MLESPRSFLSSPRYRLAALGVALALLLSLTPRHAEAINCTFRFCPAPNRCPGAVFTDTFCCPPGTNIACFYSIDAASGCVRNVQGVCL